MLHIDPNSIKNINQYQFIAFVEDGLGNSCFSALFDATKQQILVIEHRDNNQSMAIIVSPQEYAFYLNNSDWINCRGKYAPSPAMLKYC